MVIVVNRHHDGGERGMYIGRGTIYGNQFKVGVDGDRKECVGKYLVWLRSEYREKGEMYERLVDLARRHNRGERIVLVCSCKPLLCHGDVLQDAIVKIANKLPT